MLMPRTRTLAITAATIGGLVVVVALAGCGGGGGDGNAPAQQAPAPVIPSTTTPPPAPDPNVINGMTVPPDPGDAGAATVAGIDSDGNGIRDDIDRFIATKYGTNPTAMEAAQISARARQRVLLTDPADATASLIALQDSGDAGVCAGFAFRAAGLSSGTELEEIYLRTFNTIERLSRQKDVTIAAGQFTRSVTDVVCE